MQRLRYLAWWIWSRRSYTFGNIVKQCKHALLCRMSVDKILGDATIVMNLRRRLRTSFRAATSLVMMQDLQLPPLGEKKPKRYGKISAVRRYHLPYRTLTLTLTNAWISSLIRFVSHRLLYESQGVSAQDTVTSLS